MKVSKTNGIYFPTEIDVSSYDAINLFAARTADPNANNPDQKDRWFVFSSGWNGLAYRIVAAKNYNQLFAESIATSTAPPSEQAQIQDSQLFGFATSALSSIECAFL